jgi:hypothetical protein
MSGVKTRRAKLLAPPEDEDDKKKGAKKKKWKILKYIILELSGK